MGGVWAVPSITLGTAKSGPLNKMEESIKPMDDKQVSYIALIHHTPLPRAVGMQHLVTGAGRG